MKKAFVLFTFFSIFDLVLWIVLDHKLEATKFFVVCFLPLIVFEIAVYGSIIIYEIDKLSKNSEWYWITIL